MCIYMCSSLANFYMHLSSFSWCYISKEMKCPKFLLLVLIFSLSRAILGHSPQHFLHCLSLHSANSASNISNLVYTQSNSSYASILNLSIQNQRFSTSATPKPFLIVTPLQVSHIQATISCSKQYGLQIRIRSGGHDFEGLSYISDHQLPFLILDLVNFRSVRVDVKNKVAWVESGATIGELYYRIAEKSKTLAFPAGVCPTVGVGGHFSGGGYGILMRKYGLAADHVVDAHLIDVDGRFLDRKSMGEDLFWAIRGGGGNTFGIVLAWKVRLVSVPPVVTAFTVNKKLEQNLTKILHHWQYIAHKLPQDISIADVMISKVNSSEETNNKQTIQASFKALYLGGVDKMISLMQEKFPQLGVVKGDCTQMSWVESVLYFGGVYGAPLDHLLDRTTLPNSIFKAKSDYMKEPIPKSGFEGLYLKLLEKEATMAFMMMVAFGAKMDEIPEAQLPYPHRAGNLFQAEYLVAWSKEENAQAQNYVSWIRRVYEYMAAYASKSPREAYINYRDLDIGMNNMDYTSYEEASNWGRKYFKNNFARLVRVKTKVDPENFFKNEQSVPPCPLSSLRKINKGD